jgi:hypothetical protein
MRHRPGVKRLLGRMLLIVLAVWALALILPDSYRVVAPLASLGLSADDNGTITNVRVPFKTLAESPAARAGLVPGDRLDLGQMRCIDPFSLGCADIVAVLGDFGGAGYVPQNERVRLIIRPVAGGPSRTVEISAAPSPMNWHARVVLLADTIVGALFIGVAFHLAWTRASRMTWGFFLYAIWFNSGQDYAAYAFLQSWPPGVLIEQGFEAVIQGAAYAGLLTFAMRFPNEHLDAHWRPFDAALSWLAIAVAVLALAGGLNVFGYPTAFITNVFFFSIVPLDIAALAILLIRLRQLRPQDEERMRWAVAGCAIGLPAFLLAELCTSTALPYRLLGIVPSLTIIELLFLFHGVIAYFVGIAVRRRRVVSVAIPLRRGAILAALTFILGVPIVYLHGLLDAYNESLGGRFSLPEWIWPLVIGPLSLLALTKLHERAVNMTERVFNRRYHRARASLHHAAQAAMKAKELADVDRLLAETPVAGLRLSSAAVFRSIDGVFRRMDPAAGWPEPGLRTLDRDHDRLPLDCLSRGAPLPLPRGHWYRPGLPPDDEAPCLAVPVHGGATESIAIVLLGPHASGSDINHDERELLRGFASQAALAYDRVETETLRREVATLRAALAVAAPATASAVPSGTTG